MGNSLIHAHEILKKDKKIVLEAVKNNCYSIVVCQ